jgi:hypothetical protein
VPVDGTAQGQRNARFQNYLETLNLFRGGTVSTEAGVKERVKQALFEAVISLAQSGVREASRAKYYRGTALDWTRLDLASRREAMIKAAKQGLVERAGSKDSSDDTAFVTIAGKQVLFVVDAVPAPFSAINFLPFRPKRISFLIDLS